MDLFDLFCKISIDTGDTNTKIDSVSQKMQTAKKSLENVGTAVKNAGKTFAAIGTGVMAAGTAVFAFTNKITQNGDAIDKNSQKLGISAEAYQEWDFIMQHCGSTIEGLKPSMKTLANAAADGNDSTAAAFKKLGLSIDEVSAMSQEDLFATVIERLQEMGEGTERTAIASDLLGRAAIDLGPVLNMSAEETEALRQQVHELGGVMSNEAVANSAAFQDSLYNVKVAFSGAANSLAEELIPNITSLMDKVSAFVADGGIQKIIDGFERMVPVITGAVAAIVTFKTVSAISGVVSALTKAIDGQAFSFKALAAAMNTNPFVLIVTAIAAVVTALVTLWNTNEGFREAVKKIWNDITGFFTDAWAAIKGVWDKVAGFFSGVWDGIKGAFSSVGSWFSEKFTDAKEKASNAWNNVKSKFSNHWNNIKGAFSDAGSWFSDKFSSARDKAVSAWDSAKSKFSNIWESIKETFRKAIDKLKSFLKFDWSLPKIKLPHFSISGKFSLNPPQIPHFSIEWYKKAMNNAMWLDGATIFGMSGNTLLGGGEAGPELIVGANTLKSFIEDSVIEANTIKQPPVVGAGRFSALPPIALTVNVNGLHYMNASDLARDISEDVAFEIQRIVERKEAIFCAP